MNLLFLLVPVPVHAPPLCPCKYDSVKVTPSPAYLTLGSKYVREVFVSFGLGSPKP